MEVRKSKRDNNLKKEMKTLEKQNSENMRLERAPPEKDTKHNRIVCSSNHCTIEGNGTHGHSYFVPNSICLFRT